MAAPLTQSFELTLADSQHAQMTLSEILARAEKTLLYFYPKDNTPGCTLEAQDFTRLKKAFADKSVQVIGVSKDSTKSHEKFQESCGLGIDLISDEESTLHDYFKTVGEKNMYGRIVFGVIRSTFLLDKKGTILKEWRSVKATGHAEKVLASL